MKRRFSTFSDRSCKWQIASLAFGDRMVLETITELGYRKISWFVSVGDQFGLVKELICPPLTNHDILLNLVQ